MKNFKWDKKYLYWGVTAFCVVVASIAFFWLLNTWSGVRRGVGVVLSALAPVIYGLCIAYLLNKVLNIFETHIFSKLCGRMFKKDPVKARKAARIFSIIVTLTVALGLIAGLFAIVLPELADSVMTIVSNSRTYLNVAIQWLEKVFDGYALEPVAVEWFNTISSKVVNWLETEVLPEITTLIGNITGGVISVITTLFNLFVGIVISVYVMYNKETFAAQAKKIVYSVFRVKTANAIMGELEFINDAFGDYIVGTVIDSLIVGLINYIFMTIMGMPYAVLVTIMVAVTNLIPMFGPFIGAVPSTLLILLENPTQALIFVIFTVILQQIDGQILKPRIHSSRTGLSGFWIMFAILFFGGLFGILGMVIGVPVTTVLYNMFRRLNNRRLRRRTLPEDTSFYRGLSYIDPVTMEPRYGSQSAEGQEPEGESGGKMEETAKAESAAEAPGAPKPEADSAPAAPAPEEPAPAEEGTNRKK